jgi:hypothetical protein
MPVIKMVGDGEYYKEFVENNPSQLIDVNSAALKDVKKYTDPPEGAKQKLKEEEEDLLENSPFPWDPNLGYIVPGEDIDYLSGKLSPDQLEEVKLKAKNKVQNWKPSMTHSQALATLGGDTETISTDSVDDRFDNI